MQRQLADLGVQLLEVHRRFGAATVTAEDGTRALLQLRFPDRDLVRVDVELLRQLGQRLLSLDRRERRLRLEGW